MKDLLISLATSEQLAPFLLGTAVPMVYAWLQEGQIALSTRARFGLNVALCIAAAFIPLSASWVVSGIPSGEAVFTSITAALVASESAYRLYFKPKAEQESAA